MGIVISYVGGIVRVDVCVKVVDRIGMQALGGETVRLAVFDKMMYYSLIT